MFSLKKSPVCFEERRDWHGELALNSCSDWVLLGVKDRSFVGPPKTEMYYEEMQKLQCEFVFGTSYCVFLCVACPVLVL